MEDAFIDALFATMPLLVLGGLVAQWQALRRFEGVWLLAACVPAVVMTGAFIVGIGGAMAGSNLAPIWIVFALPPCLMWLAGLWLLRGLAAIARG